VNVRLTQLDGKLPNFALMRLSGFHKARGDAVHFSRSPYRRMDEPDYGAVYGSTIFDYSRKHVEAFRREFPEALIGGTGVDPEGKLKVESVIGDYDGVDYDHWPDFTASLGFSQRGCRFKCTFCVVPGKEGKPVPVSEIAPIWRGAPYPKHIHLLDNDFFGVPKVVWKSRLAEIREGKFKVCFNQGINIRVITDEIAVDLASIKFTDDSFKRSRLYTAWDSIGDEALFFRGVDRLRAVGIKPSSLMVYMLTGDDPDETWASIFHRFNRMRELKIKPYIMTKDRRRERLPLGGYNGNIGHQRLMDFQRWVNSGIYRGKCPDFADYRVSARAPAKGQFQPDLLQVVPA